ncbi:hypothetical protein ATANTOWER_013744 [Ataeniobius toweri]|uniref:Uncharacterized protein n=1 Tax=Ataeniobius toweri TaxID=208326 RepID=A0ABU7BG35_9TELE|nr:hypothetical protein [Ataeniobius toweri]
MLDHLFAEYWTICTLLDTPRPSGIIGHFVSQYSPLLQIPAGTAADMTGHPKSDVTGDYIGRWPFKEVLFQLKPRRGYHATGASILEKKSHVDFHSFSPLANEKEKFMKEVSGIGRPEISLYRSKM